MKNSAASFHLLFRFRDLVADTIGVCQRSCRCAKKEKRPQVAVHAVSVMRVGPSVSPIRR